MSRKHKTTERIARDDGTQNKRLWRALLAVVIVSATGMAIFAFRGSSDNSVPPTLETDDVDPAINAAVQSARQQVIEQPRSADAWGHFGMTLGAHGFNDRAVDCFIEAAKLNRQDLRWPYLHARCITLSDSERAKELLIASITLANDPSDTPRLFLVEKLLEEQRLEQAESYLNAP